MSRPFNTVRFLWVGRFFAWQIPDSGSARDMTPDIDDAAGTVIDLTNTIGATAAGLQNTTQTVRALRRFAIGAARHPDRVAAAGVALLVTAGVLALRRPEPPAPTL
jgi:hypothetical protein